MVKFVLIIVMALTLGGCSTAPNPWNGDESIEGYEKSPCACYEGYEIFNGQIYKTGVV